MKHVILFVVGLSFFICLLVCVRIWFFWLQHPANREKRDSDDKRRHYLVTFGVLITLGIMIGSGLHTLLVFIPDSWGFTDSEGEYQTVRFALAMLGGGYGAIYIVLLCGKLEKLQEQNMDYLRELAIYEEMERVLKFSPAASEAALGEIDDKLSELRAIKQLEERDRKKLSLLEDVRFKIQI